MATETTNYGFTYPVQKDNPLEAKLFLDQIDTALFGVAPPGSVALADPGGNGMLARTALGVTTNRTITGTANQVTVSNGDGVAGNPTLSIPSNAQLSIAKLTNLTGNGFVRTSGGDGTLSVGSLSAGDIPDLSGTYQPLDGDLTAIAALAGTSGLLKKTAANTWELDTNTYANAALSNLASVAINASLLPGTSDAVALGSTTKQWSDLFLAEGGVIDWDNGDATLTQAGNVVTLAGADLALANMTAGSVLFAGTSGLISQDNASLFFNNTDNNFGIGTATPGTINGAAFGTNVGLHVKGAGTSKYLAVDDANKVGFLLNDSSQSANSRLWGLLNQSTRMSISTFTDAGIPTERVTVSRAGDFGVGTVTPRRLVDFLSTSQSQLRLTYTDNSVYSDFTVGSGGNLTIAPTGDLIFNPTGNDILPTTNYDLNLGSLSLKYLSVHAAELWVETLVAQDTMATMGGRFIVPKGATLLSADLASGGTTITVKHNNLASGDRIWMESDGKFEMMAVTSGAGGSAGAYTYSVTRNLDGSGANQWYAGDSIVNTGTTGDGFIELYAYSGRFAGTGPTIVGNVRTGTTYNNIEPRWAIGNLNGLYGYGSTTYGVAFGVPSGAWVKIEPTNGLRIGHNATTFIQADASGSAFFSGDIEITGSVTAGGGDVVFDVGGVSITQGAGTTNTIRWLNGAGQVTGQVYSQVAGVNQTLLTATSRSATNTAGASVYLAATNTSAGVIEFNMTAEDSATANPQRAYAYLTGTAGLDFRGLIIGGILAPAAGVQLQVGGGIRSSSPTGGIGYSGGAGGGVTQATSKATGVTLNKVCGLITLHAAALAADALVTFTVTNSAVEGTDMVIAQHDSVGTKGAYTVTPHNPTAGSFQITLRNISAGSLSEAIVLRFVVIKAVVS